MSNDFLKIKIHNEINYFEETENDFGIYTYLRNNNLGEKLVLSASVYDDSFVIITDYSSKRFHEDMQKLLFDRFGVSDFYIQANGNYFAIWKSKELSSLEFDVILGIINEIKQYPQKFSIPIFIGINIPNIVKEYDSDFDMEELVDTLMNEKQKYENKFIKK